MREQRAVRPPARPHSSAQQQQRPFGSSRLVTADERPAAAATGRYRGPRAAPVDSAARRRRASRRRRRPRTIVVIGDAMADWLAYGLEERFSETPEIGIVRKLRANSGLIRYDPRRDTLDWPQTAREDHRGRKAEVHRHDGRHQRPPGDPRDAAGRRTSGEAARRRQAGPAGQRSAAPEPEPAGRCRAAEAGQAKPRRRSPTAEQAAPSPAMAHRNSDRKWAELPMSSASTTRSRRSRARRAGVLGRPAVAARTARDQRRCVYLNDLYRTRAEKAGIIYVDIWDGFVDEAGRYRVQGPDFEGQIRRLRSGDGVYFTQAGAAQARALCRARNPAQPGRTRQCRWRCRRRKTRPSAGAGREPRGPAPRPAAVRSCR